MPEFHVAQLSKLEDNVPTDADAGDTGIVLVRRGDAVFALAGKCPHRGVPMSKGIVEGDRIICGVHRAAFALSDGSLLAPPACEALARYDVRLDGDDVHVTVEAGQVAHPLPAMVAQGSDERRFVIVGNGAAGWRAAETLRREGFAGSITVVTQDHAQPYDRTELSKGYLGSSDAPDVPTMRDASFAASHGIELREARATGLDTDAKELHLGDERLAYDKLLIATGADANRLPVDGANLGGIHVLRTLSDAKALRSDVTSALKAGSCRVAIVGGGFVGLEAAASLSKRKDVSITVILQDDKPMAALFGAQFADRLMAEHRKAGVAFRTDAKVVGFSGDARVRTVEIENGDPVAADVVIVAVGAKPRTGWLPFDTGKDGGIAVDETLAVAPDVYLAGDIARVPTPWGKVRIEHWRFAQECGELAARNMLGAGASYEGTPFFWSAQQIGGSYTYTGHTEGFDSIEGDVTGDPFAAAYIEDGKMAAVLGHGIVADLTRVEPAMAGRGPLPASARPKV